MNRAGIVSVIMISCGSRTPGRGVAPSSHCPRGNGFYVLYYGTAEDDFDRIKAAAPNFVVLGDGLEIRSDLPRFFHPRTRVFVYLPARRSRADLSGRIAVALGAGYDGIFFDQIDPVANAYNAAIAKQVHDADGTVIMNPGVANVGRDIFKYADIVSVENEWSSSPSPSDVEPWRYLAVQGDPGASTSPDHQAPTSGTQALERLDAFRKVSKGFWYYASEYDSVAKRPLTTRLPSWFDAFAATVRDDRASVACTPR